MVCVFTTTGKSLSLECRGFLYFPRSIVRPCLEISAVVFGDRKMGARNPEKATQPTDGES